MKFNMVRFSVCAFAVVTASFSLLSKGSCLTVPANNLLHDHVFSKTGSKLQGHTSTARGFLHDHVFLTMTGTPVDVTKTLYQVQGQTFAVLNNVPIQIVIDAGSSNVFDTHGQIIGFTVEMND